MLGNYNKAGLNYCKAIEINPMEYEAHYNLGILLKYIKKTKYALDELEKAAVLSTGNISKNSNYIFEMLNLVSMDANIIDDDFEKQLEKAEDADENQNQECTMINGKITASDDADERILESFRKCNSKPLFENK